MDPNINNLQVLPYAWSLTYAAHNDYQWQLYLNQIKSFVNIKKKKREIFRNTYNKNNKKLFNCNDKKNIRIELPIEAIAEIMSYMDASTLCCSSYTCKAWYILASNEALWEKLLQVQFSLSINSFSRHRRARSDVSAKKLFMISRAAMNDLKRPKSIHMSGPIIIRVN